MSTPRLSDENYDIVVVGAGIVGLTLARELSRRKVGRILVIEKEAETGRHASGRNSGVVHAGIYYSSDSLKAKFCVEGARHLVAYCEEQGLPILKCGKVIVATKPQNVATLGTLLERAQKNGVEAKRVSLEELRELEPEAKSHEWAIWSPQTAVIHSPSVLHRLEKELEDAGVRIAFRQEVVEIDPEARVARTDNLKFNYRFLVNAGGVNADRIAHMFDVGRKYRILPFKGLYWKSSDDYAPRIKRLIYPAPDIRMPFLGVHITRTVDDKVLFGPTAIPAFGRENYTLMGGLDLLETPKIGWQLTRMLIKNPGNFRSYVSEEMARYRFKNFYREAATMVHDLKPQDIGKFYKVGIRAQLMDLEKGQLEMDFVLEKGKDSLHVLNAISPAFTSAFAFAPYLADRISL